MRMAEQDFTVTQYITDLRVIRPAHRINTVYFKILTFDPSVRYRKVNIPSGRVPPNLVYLIYYHVIINLSILFIHKMKQAARNGSS